MTFYELDGAYGTPVSYSVYGQKQTTSWRLILGLALLLLVGISGLAISQTINGVVPVFAAPVTPRQVQAPKPVAPVAAVAKIQDRSPELQTELEAWVTSQKSSKWSFYVRSLDDDSMNVGVAETEQFQMASIYKLFLLKPLASKIPAEAWSSSYITDRTYQECVHAMLAVSDNPCAEAIAGKLGWTTLHKQVQISGYRQTTLNDTEKFGTSSANVGLLLDRLFHGDGYDAKTKEITLNALGKRKGSEAIRKGCADCTVFNKTGDLGGFKHDAAIVSKDGKNYVVVIFSKDANWSQLIEASGIISSHL